MNRELLAPSIRGESSIVNRDSIIDNLQLTIHN